MPANETIFNAALADELSKTRSGWDGGSVVAETSGVLLGGDAERLRPDILLCPDFISPVIIECAYEGTADIDGDAIKRLGKRHTSGRHVLTVIALKIPAKIKRMTRAEKVAEWLAGSGGRLEYAVYSISDPDNLPAAGYDYRFPRGGKNSGYLSGTVGELSDLIELAALPSAVVKKTIDSAVAEVKAQAFSMTRDLQRDVLNEIAAVLSQPADDDDALKVAACIWLNAMVLHGRLANAKVKDADGKRFEPPWQKGDHMIAERIIKVWEKILDVNYRSVFNPAMQSLRIADNVSPGDANRMAEQLAECAKAICSLRLGAIGDIAADMYPMLAADRKATAAFYTMPEVGEFLATLAMDKAPKNKDGVYKVADFACGTGTLLKSIYRAIRREVQKSGAKRLNMRRLHQEYMENHIFGADIQPIAAHLSVAGLAGMSPEFPFSKSNVICAQVRGGNVGSLSLLDDVTSGLLDMLNPEVYEGVDDGKLSFEVGNGAMDICILNPPYTGARAGHRLFDITGLPEEDRKRSIERLKRLKKHTRFAGSQAGLGAVFSGLAHNKLKEGGVYAFVLPLSAASQGSWRALRGELVKNYTDIIAVSAPESLSADTGMREMMICARKKIARQKSPGDGGVTQVNLRRIPQNMIEAHEYAKLLRDSSALPEGNLTMGKHVFATCARLFPANGDAWGGLGCESGELAKTAESMNKGVVYVPGTQGEYALPISCQRFYEHCEIGPTHDIIGHLQGRDDRGAYTFYEFAGGAKSNKAMWAANHQTQRALLCKPTHYGQLYQGRKRAAATVNEKTARLFISRGLRYTSQAPAACVTEEKCHGGGGWTALLCDERARAAYCLWLNSIFGLIARWQCGGKQQLGRAMMQITDIKNFRCPAFSEDSPAARHACKTATRKLKTLMSKPLQPCSCAWRDETRKQIDKAVIDMLQLPVTEEEAQELRELWCADITVHGCKREIMDLLREDGLLPAQ